MQTACFLAVCHGNTTRHVPEKIKQKGGDECPLLATSIFIQKNSFFKSSRLYGVC